MIEPSPRQQAPPRQALQERVARAILEAAARLLAQRGGSASMNDVAAAAGVARATVYRYFPTRQALLDRLAAFAVAQVADRLRDAALDRVPPEEAIVRAVRAFVDAGDVLTVLAREDAAPSREQLDVVIEPLRGVIDRGQTTAIIRPDVSAAWLTEALVGLVVASLSSVAAAGRDDTVAAVATLFLDGARPRPRAAG